MLPKEKNRAIWSMLIGLIIAGAILGADLLRVACMNRSLQLLIAECEKPAQPPVPKNNFWANTKLVCDPKRLKRA